MKGLAVGPDGAAEGAGRKPDGKALRMATLRRAISHAEGDTRAAALLATLNADAKGVSLRRGLRLLWTSRYLPLAQLRRLAGVSIAHSKA